MSMNTGMSMSMSININNSFLFSFLCFSLLFACFWRSMAFWRALRGKISRSFILAYAGRRIWLCAAITFRLLVLVTGRRIRLHYFPKIIWVKKHGTAGGRASGITCNLLRRAWVLRRTWNQKRAALHCMALDPPSSLGRICM